MVLKDAIKIQDLCMFANLTQYTKNKIGYILELFPKYPLLLRNHSIFRHDDFISCFSADKIKKFVRKYFCFNIPIYKNMAEETSCRSPYHEGYIQTSASGNPEGLYH